MNLLKAKLAKEVKFYYNEPMFNLASYIDHTLLKLDASEEDIKRICDEAIKFNFVSVCVYPKYLTLTSKLLSGKTTIPITVVDFPLGEGGLFKKVEETKAAISMGAKEIDVVMNYKALKRKEYGKVLEELKAVVKAAAPLIVKVIIETCFLDREEKIIAAALVKASGAAFVKTSTGLGSGGATIEDVELLRKIVGNDMGVKASGGIRSFEEAIKMINAGASRIGTSASVKIMEGYER